MKATFYDSLHGAHFAVQNYGAWRWHELLGQPGCWYVVSLNCDFDRIRGLQYPHFKAVVDDFGNLVLVN
jgi:hypothetical protein